MADDPLHAITFDCWGTLIYEPPADDPRLREDLFLKLLADHGLRPDESRARRAFQSASDRHWQSWRDGVSTGAGEITRWSLEALEIGDEALGRSITGVLQEHALGREVRALEGARTTLERLAERGIRRGLICDTGFTPGRVVRALLDRVGLLEWLEVLVFSDEAGVPKPDPSVFHSALQALDVAPARAAHVGDLRRTDVLGARSVGMRSVRIRDVNDDDSEFPDADHVVDSHGHLVRIFSL